MNRVIELLTEIVEDADATNLYYRNKTYRLDAEDCPMKASQSFVKSRLKTLEDNK